MRCSSYDPACVRGLIAGHEIKTSRNSDGGCDPKEGAAIGQIADGAINGGIATIENNVATFEHSLAWGLSLLLHGPPSKMECISVSRKY